jgi:ceramide glucosyltransferase
VELFCLTAAMRLAVAIFVGGRVLHDQRAIHRLALIPLRDAIAMLVWLTSFAGHTVSWRGDIFKLQEGKLIRIRP